MPEGTRRKKGTKRRGSEGGREEGREEERNVKLSMYIRTENMNIHEKWASLLAQMVKNMLALQETQVQSLGLEDLLKKRMATHSSILAWRIPWIEEPGGLQSMESQRVRHD